MKNTKSQLSNAAAVILIVIVLVIAAVVLTLIIIKPSIFFQGFGDEKSIEPVDKEYVIKVSDNDNKNYETFTCNLPYIKMGMSCCLDKNYNNICDSDEQASEKYEKLCDYPYVAVGSKCCIDDDRDKICDFDERYYDDERDDAYLSNPFSVYDFDINSDEIVLWIKNKGDETVTITRIEIEDCDDYNDETTLEENERERFEFNCDRDSNFDRDILVTYTIEGSDDEKTSRGNVERRDGYGSSDYYGY